MIKGKSRILVVDDSFIFRRFMSLIIGSDPDLEVVGTAINGRDALEKVKLLKPDLITIDVDMPGIDGFEATQQILQIHQVPIIIISGHYNSGETDMTFNALKAGAVFILAKPVDCGPAFELSVKHIIQTIKLMAHIKVRKPVISKQQSNALQSVIFKRTVKSNISLIAIGASAGGPPVLQEIIGGISPSVKVPIVIVQHIDAVFSPGFCKWLKETTGKEVVLAQKNDILQPGVFYLAPGNYHMSINSDFTIDLNQEAPEHSCRPSVSHMFRSIKNSVGKNVLAIILTGMGRDGSAELKELRDIGCTTIAQDAASVLINGMPGEAVKLGGAMHILPPPAIVSFINNVV